MNSNRKNLRRTPELIVDVQQPFDPNKFNFTKVKKEEHLLQLVYKSDSSKVCKFNDNNNGIVY